MFKFGALILVIALVGGPGSLATGAGENVTLMVGRSAIVDTGTPIARVSLTSPDVADALVTSSSELLINGKTPGTISLFVWDRAGAIRRYEVVVTRDLARLSDQMRDLFPGESIGVQSTGKHIVLTGSVTQKDVIEKAISVAAGYVEKKDEVVSLLQLQAGQSRQVLLRVRFAEVSRTALTELAVNLFTGPNGFHDVLGRSTTQQYPAPAFDSSGATNKLVFSDFLNLFFWDMKNDFGAVVKALQTRGLLQTLAEPNLVAESGKEASFLAGGEFPVPIAQPNGSAVMVTVQYKEFGIRLNFTPEIAGDRIHLKVRPEVSTLDYSNAVTLNGFRIPALTTRRTETELELGNGQPFAIAGLMNNQVTNTLQKIPGIGDIPILGYLFRSQSAQKDRSELVVMITPEILANNSYGVTPNLPRTKEPFLPTLDPKKSFEMPAPAFKEAPATAAAAPAAAPQAPASHPELQQPTKFDRPSPNEAAATLGTHLPDVKTLPHIEPAPFVPEPPAAVEGEAPAPATRPLSKKQQKQLADQKKAELEKQKAELEKQKVEEEKKKKDEHQKAVAEAQAQLKAAQTAYDAAKAKKP
jgi:pilus assembly protein CpaC